MEVAVLNTTGDTVSQLQISDYVFNIPVNTAVMHQVLVAQNNNARLGTANTKTRSEVTGSTRKLFAQKHTGRARRGSIKSPLLKGGGIVFGPHPRSYKQKLN
ncbi:MAG: 50S ribosomal protein L4, partial [Dehalococcoidia bacterium]|nr:50S ribosomal protein L4 [Dehalococcoidia bacterium]